MIQKIGDAAPQENLSLPKIRKFGLAASNFTGNSITLSLNYLLFVDEINPKCNKSLPNNVFCYEFVFSMYMYKK